MPEVRIDLMNNSPPTETLTPTKVIDTDLGEGDEMQNPREKPNLEISVEKATKDFFSGFFLHCCISIPTAILGFVLGFIGLFGDPDSTLVLWPVILTSCLFYPYKLLYEKKHARLVGSIVSIPACMFVVLVGITFGIIQRFGIF